MNEYAAEKSGAIRQGARIFYRAWSHNRPTGGQKQMYRHVDILNSAGFEAYIFHHEDGFRVSWFDNDTRVVGLTAFKSLYRPGDILVLPEDVGQALWSFPGPKVIFNQNIYYGYMALGEASLEQYPYQDTGLLGIITVSSHNGDNLTYAFPEARVLRLRIELKDANTVVARTAKAGINLRLLDEHAIAISLDEATNKEDVSALVRNIGLKPVRPTDLQSADQNQSAAEWKSVARL